jgi:hypothetical protein
LEQAPGMNIVEANRDAPSKGFMLAVLAVLVANAACFAYAIREYFVDDAYIGLQYLRNLLSGEGFVFRAGQPAVEGVTNIGWPLLLAPLAACTTPTVAAKLLGLLLLIASFALTVRLGWALAARCQARAGFSSLAIVPVLLLAASFEFVYFSLAGMETALLATVLLCMSWVAVRKPDSLLLPLLGALSFLVHPEAVAVYPFYTLLAGRQAGRRKLGLGILLLAVLVGVATAIRYAVFGDVVPNTFHSKPSSLSLMMCNGCCFLGGRNVNIPFPLTGWLVLPLVGLGYLGLRRVAPGGAAMLSATAAIGFAFAIYSLPDWTETARYFAPYLPSALLLFWAGLVEAVGLLLPRASQRPTRDLISAAATVLLTAAAMLGGREKMAQMETFPGYVLASKNLVAPALWMRDHLPAGATIATRRIGALAYYSEKTIFDYTFGLTDREVARLVAAAGRRFDFPNDPALAEVWRRRSPDYLLEDAAIIDIIAAEAGGTRGRFPIHDQLYGAVQSFCIGPGKDWVLARRLPPETNPEGGPERPADPAR